MSTEDTKKPLTHEEVLTYLDTHACPRCKGHVETKGDHERDSSNDMHSCPKCGWRLSEMGTWVRR